MLRTVRNTIVMTALAAFVLSAASPILGTWKMNVAKSKFNPGPGPKGGTVVYTQEGDWIILKSDVIGADGKPVSRSNRYKLDGKEYPYEGPLITKGTIAVKKIDDHRTESVIKGANGNVVKVQTVISKDGKTRTQTSTGTNSEGQKTNNTVIYEKQ
jgi:hypothetical protein